MNGGWTPERLDELTRVMLPVATDLTCSVREHNATAIAALLTPMDPIHLRALAVVLAAMVPDDVPLDDLIAWTRKPRTVLEPITTKHACRNREALARAIGVDDDYKKGAA